MEVLVVDDQEGVRSLLELVVKDEGHQVYTARNGLEAISIVQSKQPDLIFMDVRMPLVDGLGALGKIKAISPGTDVIMMTAFGSEETISEALEKGALFCLAKPFDVDTIRKILARYGAKCRKLYGLPACAYAFKPTHS